jgi:hypothetical protein
MTLETFLALPEDETSLEFDGGLVTQKAAPQLRALRGDDRIDLDEVLPGFDLTVNELFASVMDDWMLEEPAEQG